MNAWRTKRLFGLTQMSAVVCLLQPTASALADDDISPLQEVIVTAQKREQSAQKVGISISAFTGEQLKDMGVHESIDIARFTPSVSISGSYAGLMSQFSIRGVTQNDFVDHVEAPLAVYIDEGYVAMQQGQTFSMFDIDHVEVLKGPQGTLFGRNATGGLIHFISKKPTDELDAYADLTYGSYNQVRFEGAVGGPLSENVAGRISVLYNRFDPVIDNRYPETFVPPGLTPPLNNGTPQPTSAGDVMDDDTWAVRGQLRFRLGEETEMLVTGFDTETRTSIGPYQSIPTVAHLDANGGQINTTYASPTETREMIGPGGTAVDSFWDGDGDGQRPIPGADFFGYRDPDGIGFNYASFNYAPARISRLETYGGNVKIETPLGDTTITSISDYKHYYKFIPLDLEAAPEDQFIWLGEARARTFTEELRLSAESDKTRWVVGLYFLDISNENATGLSALSSSGVGFGSWDQPRVAKLDTTSYALFGQIERDLTDTLTLIAGARGTTEKKDYFYEVLFTPNTNPTAWDFANSADVPGFSRAAFTARTDSPLWTGKLQLDWKPARDVLIYGGINRGVKAGNFNAAGPGITDDEVPYKKETLTSYEVGFKSTLFNGTARLNGAVYYYDYRDYQASRWVGFANIITNKDATNKGAELDLTIWPSNAFNVLFTIGAFDAVVEDVDIAGTLTDVRPTFAPELTSSMVVRYRLPPQIFGGDLTLQGDVTYQSSFYDNLTNFNASKQPGYALGGLRASWSSSGSPWQVDLFVKNITDKRYNAIGFDLSQICGCNLEAQGKPRWFGASLHYEF